MKIRKLVSPEDAERFLRRQGLTVGVTAVSQVVWALLGRGDRSFYDLYKAGEYEDGRARKPACAKGTFGKIQRLFKCKALDPFVEYVESQGVGPEEATPTPPESDRRSLPDNEELSVGIRQLQQSRLSLISFETDGLEMFVALGDEFSTGIVHGQILGTLKTKLGGGNDWVKQFRAVVGPMVQANVVKPDPRGDAPLHDVYYLTDFGVRVLNHVRGTREG